MRIRTLIVALLLACTMAVPVTAQDSALTRLLAANRHPLGLLDGRLTGAGGRVLIEGGLTSRFFLIGEEHQPWRSLMRQLLLGITTSAFLTVACSPLATSDPEVDRAAIAAIAAITAQTQAAESAGSVEAMRVHFADDLVMMAPNMPPVAGADSVAAAMQALFDGFAFRVEYSSQEIAVAGDWAFDRGTYRQTMTPRSGGAPMSDSGKYLWLYRRLPDGSWKQSRVIWNTSDPLAAQ